MLRVKLRLGDYNAYRVRIVSITNIIAWMGIIPEHSIPRLGFLLTPTQDTVEPSLL